VLLYSGLETIATIFEISSNLPPIPNVESDNLLMFFILIMSSCKAVTASLKGVYILFDIFMFSICSSDIGTPKVSKKDLTYLSNSDFKL